MDYNSNYDFKYPGGDDFYNVEDFNENFNKVANELDGVKTSLKGKASVTHTHAIGDLTTGVLPVTKGGTGCTSIDTTPISRSKKMVTSGGVYEALEGKQNKYSYVVAVNGRTGSSSPDVYLNSADFIFDCSSGFTSANGLNNFLASLPEGSKVIFAPGAYLISSNLQINSRLWIEGLNHNAIFYMINDTVMLNIGDGTNQASNVTVRNIYFRKWDYSSLPPSTDGGKNSAITTSKPIITVAKGNGVYIEKCGLYNQNAVYKSSYGYNSLIKFSDYNVNCIVEKCVFNTNVHNLSDNGKRVGFAIDLSGCENQTNISFKFIANFGTTTYFKPKSISARETTCIGCTGVKEYNEDNIAVSTLEEVPSDDSVDI